MTINISDKDFGMMLNCAVRYAIGRKVYVPNAVINYIKPMLQDIPDDTLSCMVHDIESAKNYRNKSIEPKWLDFLDEIQKEQQRRHKDDTSKNIRE